MARYWITGLLLTSLLVACNGDNNGADCPGGTEGCPCRDAGICEVGLICNPDGVCEAPGGDGISPGDGDYDDPDPDFRIRGQLVDATGASPGADVDVYIYQAPSVLDIAPDLLHFQTVAAAGTYTQHVVTTDADGTFLHRMQAGELNPGTDFFIVVYFEGGVEDAQLAAASNWHTFNPERREWNIRELALWDAPTAEQTGGASGDIAFDWSAMPAPSGRVASVDIPSYLFAYDVSPLTPRWASYQFDDTVVVPRSALPNNSSVPEDFYVIAATQPSTGGDTFQHRSSVKPAETGWTAQGGTDLVTGTASVHQGEIMTNLLGPSDLLTDNDLGTSFDFEADTQDLYIGLGSINTIGHIFLYDLTVSRLHTSVIKVETTDVGLPNASTVWTPLETSYTGFWQGDNWLYLATGGGDNVNWIRIYVEPAEAGGLEPAFLSVAELRVVP